MQVSELQHLLLCPIVSGGSPLQRPYPILPHPEPQQTVTPLSLASTVAAFIHHYVHSAFHWANVDLVLTVRVLAMAQALRGEAVFQGDKNDCP